MVNITIHGRIPSKKNSKRIVCRSKFPLLLPSEAHEKWYEEASYQIKGTKPFKGEIYQIAIKLFPPDKIKGDLSNKAESIMDLLVGNGIIKDDNWFEVPRLSLVFGGVDKTSPRAEIAIL